MKEINLDTLFEAYTDEAAAKEASSFKTIPTGSYNHKGDKVTVGVGDDERMPALLGRTYARMEGSTTTKTGDRRGKSFFDVSWEVYRVNPATSKPERITDENRETSITGEWPLDKASKLWGQLATAFDATKKPVKEVLEMYKMYPTVLFITESFQTIENGRTAYKTPKSGEERGKFVAAGYTPKNFVQSISKVK